MGPSTLSKGKKKKKRKGRKERRRKGDANSVLRLSKKSSLTQMPDEVLKNQDEHTELGKIEELERPEQGLETLPV